MSARKGILAVDDTLAALKLLTDILTQEGYAVRPASSGEQALASVFTELPELILLDVKMPGMDGFEVCRRLKADPAAREIPVLFLSASTDLEERVKGFELGATDFIAKPFQRDELLARVRTHLELSRFRTHLETLVEERTEELKKANEKLQAELGERLKAEERIRLALGEKEVLIRELYHRTKNNMQVICSMLLLQAYDTDDENVQNILGAMESRIHSMALIHQKLYQSGNLCNISTREYIVELAQMICENYGCNEKNISMSYDIDDFSLNIEYALPCGLILNELITNSLKHAFCRPAQEGGNIYLAFKKGPEREVFIKVSDDGHGAIKDFDPARNSKLGLQIILAIVEHQLEGSIVFENIKGFSCGITFKEKDIKSLYEIK